MIINKVDKMNKTFSLPMSIIAQIRELSDKEQIPQKDVLINAVKLYADRNAFLRQLLVETLTKPNSPGHDMVDAQTAAIRAMFEDVMEKSCIRVIKAMNNNEHCYQQSEKNK